MADDLRTQLSTTFDLNQAMHLTVRYGMEHLPADVCSLRFVEGHALSIGAAAGYTEEKRRQHRVLIDDWIRPVIEHHQILAIADLESRGAESTRTLQPSARVYRSYLGVPVVVEGACIALLSFCGKQPHSWTDEEIARAQNIAEQAALPLWYALRYQQACEKAERLDILQQIVKALNAAETLDRIFRIVAVQTSRIVQNDRISVVLYDPEQQLLTFSIVAITKGLTEIASGCTVPVQETDLELVVQTHQPLLLDDISTSSKQLTIRLYFEGIRSFASVPILAGSECLGCLNVGSHEIAAFTPTHLETLAAIAAHLAIAIQKARLYQDLVKAQEYTAQILQTTPDAIVAGDAAHRLREFNQAAERMFGLSKEEVLETPIPELFPLDVRAEIRKLFDTVLEGEPIHAYETHIQNRQGQTIPVRLSLAHHTDAEGQVQGTVGLLRDLSKERTLEERLSYSERLRMLGELASGVAHSLNNNLFLVTTYTQDLMERTTDEDTRSELELISRAAWNCAHTVKRIHSFARTRMQAEFHRVDMSEVINDALEFTKSRWGSEAQAKGIPIQILIDHQSVPPVNGNAEELKEALTNLIVNAVDAMQEEGGQLHIGLSNDERFVHITVKDTGQGMTEEVRRFAFDPFYTTKGAEGTGLGLSTAYNIVVRHGGALDILETSPGQGTTFRISLPIDLDAPEPEPARRLPTQPAKILVVDDNPEICESIAGYLEAASHQVYRAIRGREALEIFREVRPDMVFTDLSMPDMSGWELTRRVKEISPSVGVALITGWGAQRLNQQDIEESGVDLVLGKPLRDYQVLNAVSRLRKR